MDQENSDWFPVIKKTSLTGKIVTFGICLGIAAYGRMEMMSHKTQDAQPEIKTRALHPINKQFQETGKHILISEFVDSPIDHLETPSILQMQRPPEKLIF